MLSTLLKGIELYRALKIYINANGYHAETHDENGIEFLCITSNDCGRKRILEKFMCISSGLYATTIRAIESNNVIRDDLFDSDTYWLWHDRLGHPGRDMMIFVYCKHHTDIHSIEQIEAWIKE